VAVVVSLGALTRALRKHCSGYDVILANHSFTALPTRLSGTSACMFYYVQGYEPEYFATGSGVVSRLQMGLSLLSYRLGLIQIVNSEVYRVHPLVSDRHVVPPGIDHAVFCPRPRPRRDGEIFIIGCVGRKEPVKGTRYVIEAFEQLRGRDARYRLRVAFGNLPEGYESRPGVEVVVPQDDEELAGFYRSIDVLVAAGTVQHGAPHYPVMEAMACGVPVVTTGYLPATKDNAWLVPVRDSEGICEAVEEIANHPERVPARVSAALEAVRPYAWGEVATRMLSIFREYCERR
jgi:glycosyltransferase involved in cell wall biosynthesis